MHQIESYDGENYDSASDDDDEVVGFSAELHAEYIRENFYYYKVIVYDKCIMCQTAEISRVNGKIGELFQIPHVPCKNNLLNSRVNLMVESTPDLHKKIKVFKLQ